MAPGFETSDDISTLFQPYFLSFFLASSGTTADVYLLKYTEDLDVVASDPISRGLVTPGAGHPSIQSVGFYRGENKVRNDGGGDGCACLCEDISRLSPSPCLVPVCVHESLNGRKIKESGKGLRRVLSLSAF